MTFEMGNAQFQGCNIQMNTGNGTQINDNLSEATYANVNKICSELKSIAAENKEVRDTVQEIKSEIEKGASKKKINSLLSTLKNTISVVSIATRFPAIVDKVKPMIERIIG